jgi:hypothetical protein
MGMAGALLGLVVSELLLRRYSPPLPQRLRSPRRPHHPQFVALMYSL